MSGCVHLTGVLESDVLFKEIKYLKEIINLQENITNELHEFKSMTDIPVRRRRTTLGRTSKRPEQLRKVVWIQPKKLNNSVDG